MELRSIVAPLRYALHGSLEVPDWSPRVFLPKQLVRRGIGR